MKQYRFNINYNGKYAYSWGYAMYSAVLEQLNYDVADIIHEENVFTQYITSNQWILNVQDDNDYNLQDSYFLTKFNTEINLKDEEIVEVTEQKLADDYLVKLPYKKSIKLKFVTPTTFKQNGDYVLFPSKDLIMQSLTNKWNDFAEKFVIEDISWDNCKISKYNLKSAYFDVKGVRIPGFVGYVEIFFWGSESLIRLGNLICEFAKYSGVGIKTTLGMGGVEVE